MASQHRTAAVNVRRGSIDDARNLVDRAKSGGLRDAVGNGCPIPNDCGGVHTGVWLKRRQDAAAAGRKLDRSRLRAAGQTYPCVCDDARRINRPRARAVPADAGASAAADGVDDLDPVAVGKRVRVVLAARHHRQVHLDRDLAAPVTGQRQQR